MSDFSPEGLAEIQDDTLDQLAVCLNTRGYLCVQSLSPLKVGQHDDAQAGMFRMIRVTVVSETTKEDFVEQLRINGVSSCPLYPYFYRVVVD